MLNIRASKIAPGLPRRGPVFRCDHCRRLLGKKADNYWYDMRFCSAACSASYQRRLSREALAKVRQLNSRAAAADAT
jgi:hypothetical protein